MVISIVEKIKHGEGNICTLWRLIVIYRVEKNDLYLRGKLDKYREK